MQERPRTERPRQKSTPTKYYAVVRSVNGEQLMRPLVNAYYLDTSDEWSREFPVLVNIDPTDKASASHLLADVETKEILPKEGTVEVTSGTVMRKLRCLAFDREFMFGFFHVITQEGSFVASYRYPKGPDMQDLVVADHSIRENEEKRRGIWQREPMYILPRAATGIKIPLVNMWVLRGDTLRNYYENHDPEARSIPFNSVKAFAEQAPVNQEPVRQLLKREALPDPSLNYFVVCEHALVGPNGRLVTLRNIDLPYHHTYTYAMGWKAPSGITVLTDNQREEAQETERKNVDAQDKQRRQMSIHGAR